MKLNCYIVAIISSALLVLPITLLLYYIYEYFKEVIGDYNGLLFAKDIFILTVLGLFMASLVYFLPLCRGGR